MWWYRVTVWKGIELKGATDIDAKVSKHTIDMHKKQQCCGNAYQSEKEKFSSVRSGSIFSSQKKSPEKRRRKHVDNLKKEKEDDREIKSRKKLVAKQKMIIHPQSYGVVKSAPEECSPDCGAVAALSNLYGSDSD